MKWVPRKDQREALDWMLTHEACGLFAKPGNGKTAISYAGLKVLRESGEARSALVIVPLRPLYGTWPAENEKWGFGFSIGILHGAKKDKVFTEKHDVYLTNPEGVDWLSRKRSLPPGVDTLIVDESYMFKNSQAQRFKTLRTMLPKFKNRVILNGNPRTHGLEDLWSQVCILDNGKRLGGYISHFRREYMVNAAPPMAAYSDWQPAVGAEAKVYSRIADICLTIESPRTDEPVMNDIAVPMPASMKAEYKRMEDQFYAELGRGAVTAANAGVKSMKLRQMTGGFVYGAGKDDVIEVHTAKLDAAVAFIDELGNEPLLIAVNFDHEAEALRKRVRKEFKFDPPYFGGAGVKGADATAAIDAWNAGRVPVLIANPQSASRGLNLQHGGSNVLWYSLTYNWGDYDQFNARVDRPGQTKLVTISKLLMDNSVDHMVNSVLQGRGAADKNLFTQMRKHYEQQYRRR